MSSNATRGAYFKAKTRKWLLTQGWQVADLEIVRWVFTPKGRLGAKRDQFGADLLAMRSTGLLFVQVKGGKQAAGQGQFPSAQREFQRYDWPTTAVRLAIIAWAPRAREPRIIDVPISNGPAGNTGNSAGGVR